ncbi:MAG: chain-length determining protein [Bacteroidaceae bacterium]|nr:chain-length determining protein [Bacteroidaceae bacterium]
MDNKVININIPDIINLLKRDRKKIAIYSIISGIIGVALAFGTPKKYESTVMLAPEESGAGFSGSISSLASMVGMNMKFGQNGDAIYPEIYPDLMESTDFIVGLFPIKITADKTNESYEYYTYISKHQKKAVTDYPMLGLKAVIDLIKPKEENKRKNGEKADPFRLTKEEYETAKKIRENISCLVDKKTSVITIKVTDQDPLIAATLADSIKNHLQVAITKYRTQKSRNDLKYLEQLHTEARAQYDASRKAYASYADSHLNTNLQSYKLKEDELSNDMNLKYNIYQQIVEQIQLAKAKVQERTPAFTVVQGASVPLKHSNRSKAATLIMWMMLGFFIRFGILIWKNKKMYFNL